MIDEEINVEAEIFDVPVEHCWIGRLEHHVLHAGLLHDSGRNISALRVGIYCYTLGLDHDHRGTCV
jgi:hypothetical protein